MLENLIDDPLICKQEKRITLHVLNLLDIAHTLELCHVYGRILHPSDIVIWYRLKSYLTAVLILKSVLKYIKLKYADNSDYDL